MPLVTSRNCQSSLLLSLFFGVLCASSVAKAEYLGLMHGRSADVARMPSLSADVGIAFADDYQLLGARINYKLTPIFMVYGSMGFSEQGRSDGIPVGVGALYTLEGLVSGIDVGLKASYHRASFEVVGVDFDISNLALELIGSTQKGYGANGNIDFYGNIGLQRRSSDFSFDDTELSFGGGAIMPVGPGEVFVGVDIIDEAMFGGGFRFFF
jgi:hypothetical protein